ncbi:NAD(P)H-dependent oxidoreductase [Pectobacterium polonicum]|uniref:NAD(P)H-dependent oxidoreductase n=1 Tax=Pectobacterium polonicum TaxID=2485124 RepID=A0AAE9NMQ3_9GAMM|nr:NAD(P)H-dependent oxidoreductase [Pectobacterium polonicum]UVO06475.1 NAD(P)H-dependent oxidoreductase [Pectobacterium polonicum]GKW22457.1 NAD(P)H oxidoreductase [Pectobacterium carotovorum subsp. carotovorum]
MSKTLVIVAHPNIGQSRINQRWIEELYKFPEQFTVHELYAAYPDGNINVSAEQALIESHERVILQFPMFWFSTPAFLKQWIDQVLAYGWAYGPGGDKFEGKSLGLAFSTGGTSQAYQAGGQNHFSPSELTKWLELTAIFVRAKFLPSHILHGAGHGVSDETLELNTQAYISALLSDTQ